MSEFNFAIKPGATLKLNTTNKYCDKDIVIVAEDTLAAYLEGSEMIESNAKTVRE